MTYGFGSGTPDPLVVEDGTFTDLTVTGSFTSPGIDDNATSTQVTVSDSSVTLSQDVIMSGSADRIYRSVNNDLLVLSGGQSGDDGANSVKYGGSHSTLANVQTWRVNTSEKMRLDALGNLLVGATSGSFHSVARSVPKDVGNPVFGTYSDGSLAFVTYAVTGTGYNAANAAVKVNMDNTTSRSLNAAGTVNASGTDYAEYELKADDCGDFTKGDIVGFDANGKLTDVFAGAVSFAIKSTNPSYVGGDTWHDGLDRPEQPVYVGPEYTGVDPSPVDEDGNPTDPEHQAQYEADQAAYAEAVSSSEAAHAQAVTQWQADLAAFETALEEKRQYVDRIAYAGKVPVNGIDANNSSPGDFVYASALGLEVISPVNQQDIDSVTTVAGLKTLMSKMIKERDRVGKVRCYGADGRAIVEVRMG